MDSTTKTTHCCFIEEDDGFASLGDIEAGISGGKQTHHHNNHHSLLYRSLSNHSVLQPYMRNNSFSSVSSPRSGRFFEGKFEEKQPHFLDFCSLCKKPLGHNRDIYMYRGDIPFCTEECRQEQIDIDEAKEKNLNSMKSKSLRKKEVRKSTSPNKNYPFYSGTVVAA